MRWSKGTRFFKCFLFSIFLRRKKKKRRFQKVSSLCLNFNKNKFAVRLWWYITIRRPFSIDSVRDRFKEKCHYSVVKEELVCWKHFLWHNDCYSLSRSSLHCKYTKALIRKWIHILLHFILQWILPHKTHFRRFRVHQMTPVSSNKSNVHCEMNWSWKIKTHGKTLVHSSALFARM